MTTEVTAQVQDLSGAGLPPRKIKAVLLQQDPDALYLQKDIANERARLRRQHLNGLLPTQAALLALDTYNQEAGSGPDLNPGYIYTHYVNESTGQLDYIFFMHPASLATLRDNYDIIMIDCIYKTNKYNMPLCHLTGRTSTGKTFDIGYCFVANEREETYNLIIADITQIFTDHISGKKPEVLVTDKETALKNALRKSEFFSQIPQIICQWHVAMNVLTHAQHQWNEKVKKMKEEKEEIRLLRGTFMTRFATLLHCSLAAFPETWANLQTDYMEAAPDLVEYLRTEWVESSCKEEVFDCFIDARVRHFEHKSTSTNEGAHAILKKYLQNGVGDLLTVISACHTKIQGETQEI